MAEAELWGLLTPAKIEKLPDGFHGDGGNLYIQKENGGRARSWVFRYTKKGKTRYLGLGPYPDITIQVARKKAQEFRRQILDGVDPFTARAEANEEKRVAAGKAKTVNEVIDLFYKNEYDFPKVPENTKLSFRTVFKHVRDTIGERPIRNVTEDTLLETVGIREKWQEKYGIMDRLAGWLVQFFEFAQGENYFDRKLANPALRLKSRLPDPKKFYKRKHAESFPYTSAPEFVRELRAYKGKDNCRQTNLPDAIEFMLLTGDRACEGLDATWSEINLKNVTGPVWTVPAIKGERQGHKTGYQSDAPILRPISKSMLMVLYRMHLRYPEHKPEDVIFPSDEMLHRYHKITPYFRTSVMPFVRNRLRSKLKFTLHGLRGTLWGWCANEGVEYERMWEFQVGHKVKGVTGHYANQKNNWPLVTLLERRRRMMEEWGQYCSPTTAQLPDFGTKLLTYEGNENESN